MSTQKSTTRRSMTKSVTPKKRDYYTPSEKKRYYEQWQSSGQSKAQFCRTHHIPSTTFYKWIHELKSQPSPDASAPLGMTFRTVRPEARQPSLVSTIELHLTSGHYFRLPITMDVTQLKCLMEVIE